MLIKLNGLLFISSSKHTISFVYYFVGLQLFLDVRKVGNIELFFWSASLVFGMGVKWNSLLDLRLKLSRRLILIVIYILNYLVVSSCQLICIYRIVNVCDVLRSLPSWGLRGLLVRLKRLLRLRLRGLGLLLVLIELLSHNFSGPRSWHRIFRRRRSDKVVLLLLLRIILRLRFLGASNETLPVVLALG